LNGTLVWWKKIELRHSLSCWLAGEEKRNHGEAQKAGMWEKRLAFYSPPEISCTSLAVSFTILFPK
jgi:hypothetical protein